MKLRTRTLPAIGLASVLFLTGCATTSGTSSDGMSGMDHGSSSAPAEDTITGEFNDSDVTFAQMMIPHHEQAVEMSDILLAKTDVDPDVAELAEEIKAAQQPEIDQMNEWLTAWGAEPMEGMDHSAHGGMDGMMSEEDMAALEDAAGPDASRLFLEQMIVHHEGAIGMAEAEIQNGENPDAVALAETIIDTQQAEIERMQQLLAG